MSTILKALQRLEDEKSANVERSLSEQVAARLAPPDPERHGLKIGVIAISGLAVAAAAAAFLFWPTREQPDAEVAMEPPPPATATAPANAPAKRVTAEKPRRRPSARPATAARAKQDSPEVEVSSVIEVVKHLDAPPADSTARATLPKRAASPAKAGSERPVRRPSARKPVTQAARVAARPEPAPKQVASAKPPEPQTSKTDAPANSARAPFEVAALAPEPAPAAAVAPIPAEIREPEREVVPRAKLPTLNVEKTIWHPDVDRRVAIVRLTDAEESLQLKEGDAVGPLVIKAIKPGSVLFNHDGIEIVYKVGG